MNAYVSVVTPVAAYHDDYLPRAISVVQRQTIPCEHIVIQDTAHRGAGWARNQGLLQVKTPYVVFLDADDTMSEDFIERCLEVIRPHHYVYTNWMQYGQEIRPAAPRDVWMNKTYHIITTLLHTADVIRIGGFDEKLPAIEDTDFYVRLRLSGICGIHVNEPLFEYRQGGKRSQQAKELLLDEKLVDQLKQRYGAYTMGCCNGEQPNEQIPTNEQQANDLLMLAAWTGNKMYFGRITGRKYGYKGNYKPVWIDPRDVEADPKSWVKPAVTTNPQSPVIAPSYQEYTFEEFADKAFGGGVSMTEFRENVVTATPQEIIKKARKKVS